MAHGHLDGDAIDTPPPVAAIIFMNSALALVAWMYTESWTFQ